MQTSSAPVTHAPRSLWESARDLIVTIFNLFGAPEKIAALHTLQAKERALLLKWLRAGEAMVRHLLLIEAAHLPRVAPRPPSRSSRTRARKLMSFDDDQPETWRVSFRCLLGATPRGDTHARRASGARNRDAAGACVSPGSPPRLYSAWPLAERAEAMLRAFNDPAPYAKRLARRLQAEPQRAAQLTRHPPNLPNLVDDFPLLRTEAEASRKRFESG